MCWNPRDIRQRLAWKIAVGGLLRVAVRRLARQWIDMLRRGPNWKAINVAGPFGQFHSVKTTD
jgi:hypothetical protein